MPEGVSVLCVACILQNSILHLNASFVFAQLWVGTLAPLAPTPHPSSVRFLVLIFTLGDQWYIPLQRGRDFGEGVAHHAHAVCGLYTDTCERGINPRTAVRL